MSVFQAVLFCPCRRCQADGGSGLVCPDFVGHAVALEHDPPAGSDRLQTALVQASQPETGIGPFGLFQLNDPDLVGGCVQLCRQPLLCSQDRFGRQDR